MIKDAFISYGRADSLNFAQKLNQRLVELDYNIWFDFEDIPQGVDYQKQIDAGIEQADNFIFIIAPHATNSPYCRKEVELAIALNKRLIPIMHVEEINQATWQQRNPNGTEADWEEYKTQGLHSCFTNLHPELQKINWNQVSFKEGINNFAQSFRALVDILERQRDYVRQHTTLLNAALTWERQQKQSRYLLLPDYCPQAKAWLHTDFSREQPPCQPTNLHCEFITESLEAAAGGLTQVFLIDLPGNEVNSGRAATPESTPPQPSLRPMDTLRENQGEGADPVSPLTKGGLRGVNADVKRKAIATIEHINRTLRREGLTVWSSDVNIKTGTDAQAAIRTGIEGADTILYWLSPNTLQSSSCQSQVDYALQLNKRVIPLVLEAVDPASLPAKQTALHQIDVSQMQDDPMAGQQAIAQLLKALKENASYHEQHKQVLVNALKWDRQNRPKSLLLQGQEFTLADQWLTLANTAHCGQADFPATDLQQIYIQASQEMNQFFDAFISYGRADSKAFASQLHNQLAEQGLNVWFDQNDIPLGVDFQEQINAGIEKSHNFIFVIAPHSVNSPYCLKEIELALALNKRIIPVLHVESISRKTWQQRNPHRTQESDWAAAQAKGEDSSFANMHPAIGKINWIYWRETDDAEAAFEGLLTLVRGHEDYVKLHTEILGKALVWERHQKQSQYLLVGAARTEAEEWLKTRFRNEQPPCIPADLHCEFITESTKNAHNLMTQVFLSHSDEDQEIEEQVRKSLMRYGFTVWSSQRDLDTGVDFLAAIRQGIETADNVVYLMSADALRSSYCQEEIQYALSLNKRIIPLRLTELAPEEISEEVRSLQYIDLADNMVETDYQQDESDLIKILNQDSAYYAQHKMLLAQALKWDRQQRNTSILLRRHNLRNAEAWLKVAGARSLHPATALHQAFINTSVEHPEAPSLDVFVSYSRKDSDMVRKLNDALQAQGKTTWFDQESIASGTDFQAEIYQGIETSDNFLFVISPNSINSPYCAGEVEYAAKLGKRFITVLHQPVASASLHPELAKVQWIDFNNHYGDFYANFSELVRTLDTDREHVHNHTKWSQRALEWQAQDKSHDLLLRGNEFAIAQNWLDRAIQENKCPAPTPLQQHYVTSSKAEIEKGIQRKKRQVFILKSLLGLVSFALVGALGAGGFALLQYRKAERSSLMALSGKSDALFVSDQSFKALLTATEAAQTFQNNRFIGHDPELKSAIATSLLNAFVWTQEQNQLLGHSDGIKSVAFSPAGDRLATAGADHTVKIWQANGRLQFTLEGHDAVVRDVAWHPTGERFASADEKGRVIVWREDGAIIKTLDAHPQTAYAVSFSPDGNWIASAGDDGRVKIWSREGQLQGTLNHPDSVRVRDVTWSPDSQQLATVSSDRLVRIWDRNGTERIQMEGHTGQMEAVVWSRNGQLIASASRDCTVKLWTATGVAVKTLKGHEAGVEAVAFSPDSQFLATAGDDSTVRLWTIKGQLLRTFKGHQTTATGVSFSDDGKTLATSSWDQSVKLWGLDQSKVRMLAPKSSSTENIQFSPNGQVMVSVHSDRSINFWNDQGELLRHLDNAHDDAVLDADFSADGKSLVTAGKDQTIRLWDWQKGIRQRTINAHREPVNSVAISPDGQTIASASDDHTMKLWKRNDGTLQEIFAGHIDAVYQVAWHPKGERLATASADQTVMVWGMDGIELLPFRGHTDDVYSVAWSPDGELLATASADQTVKLWTQEGVLKHTLEGHTHKVTDVKFSPDGQTVVSTSADKTIKLWTLDGEEMVTLKGHKGQVTSLDFRPDEKVLATAAYNRHVIMWNWELIKDPSLDTLVAKSDNWTGDHRSLTPAQISPSAQRWSTFHSLYQSLFLTPQPTRPY
ncbi:MAG: TIR domain-containing protein [Cyanobacteria bacterium P01_F01_bin.150]